MSSVVTEELIARQSPEAQGIIRLLLAEIQELKSQVVELTPQNSSLPPSSQHPHAQPISPKSQSPRKHGGQALIDHPDRQVQRLGHDLMRQVKWMFQHWWTYQSGDLDLPTFRGLRSPIRETTNGLLQRGTFSGNRRFVGMCQELHNHREWLWTFVDTEGIEPTNNTARMCLTSRRDLSQTVIRHSKRKREPLSRTDPHRLRNLPTLKPFDLRRPGHRRSGSFPTTANSVTAAGIVNDYVYLREAVEKRGGLEKIASLEELGQAVIDGAVQRLRPKLLTEGVAIIAIFPMVFAKEVGGEILAPMALQVLGGALISDEVVDLFLPVRFYWVRRTRWLKLLQAQAEQSVAEPNNVISMKTASPASSVS